MALKEPEPNSSTAFAPVDRSLRLVDKVVDALTESIVSGRLGAGDRLPSERELCEQFGVSRPVVREAVGSLNARGLLETSPNRGHTVTAPDPATVTESLTLYLRGQRLDFDKLMAARTVLEVENAGLAARGAGPAERERLRDAEAAMDACTTPDELSLTDSRFHRVIATVGGNEFLCVMIDSLRENLLIAQTQVPTLTDPEFVGIVRRGHVEILDAIDAGDESAARAAMASHLSDSAAWMHAMARRLGVLPT